VVIEKGSGASDLGIGGQVVRVLVLRLQLQTVHA
jgi:hypothetical protein